MKITNKREDAVAFHTLKVLDVFIYEGDVYMKTNTNGSYGKDSNAICLSTGDHAWFFIENKVQPVDAELIIK